MRVHLSPLSGSTPRRAFGSPLAGLRWLAAAGSLALYAAALSGAQAQRPSDKLLATVNGTRITQADLDAAARDLGAENAGDAQGKASDTDILDYVIDSTLVLQQARSDALDKTPAYQDRLRVLQNRLMIDLELGKAAAQAKSDSELKELYGELSLQFQAQHKPLPPFEQFKPELIAYAAQKAESDLIARLRKTARIERPPVQK